jgi:hypothetical protein
MVTLVQFFQPIHLDCLSGLEAGSVDLVVLLKTAYTMKRVVLKKPTLYTKESTRVWLEVLKMQKKQKASTTLWYPGEASRKIDGKILMTFVESQLCIYLVQYSAS